MKSSLFINRLPQLLTSGLLAAGVVLTSSAIHQGAAQAFILNFGDGSQSSNSTRTGAAAKVDFDFTQSGSDVLLNLTFLNTTGDVSFGKGATSATLVGFAFDLLDGLTYDYDNSNAVFGSLYGDKSLTPIDKNSIQGDAKLQPFGTFDVGIRSSGDGGTFAGGNPQGGVIADGTATAKFTLKGNNILASTLESLFQTGFTTGTLKSATRFQEVSGPGFNGASDKLLLASVSSDPVDNPVVTPPVVTPPVTPPTEDPEEPPTEDPGTGGVIPDLPEVNPPDKVSVPEPGMILGLSFLTGGFAGFRRRKSSK